MTFNPLEQKGMPLEKQFRNWSELSVQPLDNKTVDPYTRCRVIVMNGIEVEAILNSHQFARHCPDLDVRRKLALTRRLEAQQQKAINWLLPGSPSPIETTIAYEQVAVDLTAFLARTEPDPYIKQCLEFGLLEDFDHLYRYANLLDLMDSKRAKKVTAQIDKMVSDNVAKKIVGGLTEITPGRPTIVEHRHPFDDVRLPVDVKKSDPLSSLHILTITAAEQQTMNFYMNAGNMPEEPLARALYQEIAMIEEQHVTHYESLQDPTISWYLGEVLHQYNEVYMYHSFMSQETDPRIRQLWELHLDMELGQLQAACEMMRKYENREPADFLPSKLPIPTLFEENKQFVRDILESQVNLTADGTEFVPIDELEKDHRYFAYQHVINAGEWVPSEVVIREHTKQYGKDWRLETDGPNPVEWLSQKVYGTGHSKAKKQPENYYENRILTETGERRGSMDIFTVLKKDHREAKDLFEAILKEEEIDTNKVEKLCLMLTIHMELEEKLVYPVLQGYKETAEMAEEAILEHAEAKKIIRALQKEGLEDTELKVKCEMLKLAIDHHVDEEEGAVFPKAKKVMSQDEIESIGEEFTEKKQKRLDRAESA